ncbi:MAG: insulinase family protein, partial [Myxococcota bacterium]
QELEQVTLRNVRDFVARYLVPANGILTITGRFDPGQVKAQLDRTLARLRPGRRAIPPRRASIEGKTKRYRMREYRARQPRVSVLWRLEGLGQRDRDALTLGGSLLSNYVDGAFGTQVRAGLSPIEGASFFRLDVTLPYDKPVDAANAEAEVFLRYLTAVDMPRDYLNATRQAIDRTLLFMFDTVRGRATVATQLELGGEDPTRSEAMSERLWRLNRQTIRHVAWRYLIRDRGRLVVHARPVRPRLPKLSWEER